MPPISKAEVAGLFACWLLVVLITRVCFGLV
jgi:hypothetical protein